MILETEKEPIPTALDILTEFIEEEKVLRRLLKKRVITESQLNSIFKEMKQHGEEQNYYTTKPFFYNETVSKTAYQFMSALSRKLTLRPERSENI